VAVAAATFVMLLLHALGSHPATFYFAHCTQIVAAMQRLLQVQKTRTTFAAPVAVAAALAAADVAGVADVVAAAAWAVDTNLMA